MSLRECLGLLLVTLFLIVHICDARDDFKPKTCCMEWINPCKCPPLHFTIDSRPCGSELSLNEIIYPIKRFKTDPKYGLTATYNTVIFLLTKRVSKRSSGLNVRILFVRINIPRDALINVRQDTIDSDPVQVDHSHNTIWDEIRGTHFEPDNTTEARIVAYLIGQSDWIKPEAVTIPTEEGLTLSVVSKIFPGEAQAAASYRLVAPKTTQEGQSVDAAQRDLAREHWIPLNSHQDLYILQPSEPGGGDGAGGVMTVENHFEEFVQQNRLLTRPNDAKEARVEVILD